MLQELLTGIQSLIFPANCAICRRGLSSSTLIICPSCNNRLKLLMLTPFHPPVSQGALDGMYSLYRYAPPLIDLIHGFKYQGATRLGKIFIMAMAHSIDRTQYPFNNLDAIIPIPLHLSKHRERGFNQAELLAHGIAGFLHLPIYTNTLTRCVSLPSQTHLSQKERWTNQEGTFRITQPSLILTKKILLVDDLTTSGATAQTAAFELKKQGAGCVYLLTLAKA